MTACPQCIDLRAAAIPSPGLFDGLKLGKSILATNPTSGARVRQHHCVVCAAEWYLEASTAGVVVDWFELKQTAEH